MASEMQAPAQAPAQPQGGAGAASEALIQINEGMMKLASLIDSSGLPDQDKQQFAALFTGFQQFAENLGQSASAPQPQRPGMGVVDPATMGKDARPVM